LKPVPPWNQLADPDMASNALQGLHNIGPARATIACDLAPAILQVENAEIS
jgi:hypothetical protein